MIDQWIIGMIMALMFLSAGVGYYIGDSERESRELGITGLHSDPDNIETRSRRAA